MAKMSRILESARFILKVLVKAHLFLIGIDLDSFKLGHKMNMEQQNERYGVWFGIYWLFKVLIKTSEVLFYPQMLIRSVLLTGYFHILFKAFRGLRWFGEIWKIGIFSKESRYLQQCRKEMNESRNYQQFRLTEKKYQAALASSMQEIPKEEKSIIEKVDRRFARYRDFINARDFRRIKFELRSELLRSHFGHDYLHPIAVASIQQYTGIVCCAFALLATGVIPDSLAHLLKIDYQRKKPDSSNATNLENNWKPIDYSNSFVDIPMRRSQKEDLDLLRFFEETRHSFGRSALLLSGGARMSFYHVGVVKALMERNLLPKVISGSSAGSIIAAALGCHTDKEIKENIFENMDINLNFFGHSNNERHSLERFSSGMLSSEYLKGFLKQGKFDDNNNARGNVLFSILVALFPEDLSSNMLAISRIAFRLKEGKHLFDSEILMRAVEDIVGHMTFQEAFERTGRIINISLTPFEGDRDVPFLCNYLSAPHVTVASASCASCAIPGVFTPVTLMAKNIDGNLESYDPYGLNWIDGSLESDLPMQRLRELFNVNHFIVSQVNPHAQLLAPVQPGNNDSFAAKFSAGIAQFCRSQGRSYIKHMTELGATTQSLSPLIKMLAPVLVQKYSGDLTIYPKFRIKDLTRFFQNPSRDEFLEYVLLGEHMAWEKLETIRRRCVVELMLDDCVLFFKCQRKMFDSRVDSFNESINERLNRLQTEQGQALRRLSSYSLVSEDDYLDCNQFLESVQTGTWGLTVGPLNEPNNEGNVDRDASTSTSSNDCQVYRELSSKLVNRISSVTELSGSSSNASLLRKNDD